jgi:DNA helicase-2/ATP-dependent DNA helicase PcrA
LSGAARSAAQRIGTVFGRLRERLNVLPLVELFDLIVDETGYAAGFDHDSEEEMQRWTNVLELRTDLEKYDVLAPGDALPAYLEQVALVSDVDTMEDDGRGRVTMITLHSAKGLEYPVVFIAGVEEGLLPIRRAIDAEFTDPQPLEEERRLFYVGITRAEQQLYLSYTGFRAMYGQTQPSTPSRFLANIPENHLDGTWRRSRPRHAAGGTGPRQSLTSQIRGNVTPLFGRAEPPTPPPPAPKYTAGQRVFHNRFGEGVISEVLERRGDQELAINFSKHGVKRLMGSLAPLDVID